MTTDATQRSASFQQILETAEQLIKEKGCRQTTLQDIIERTGLSKGAIYHYVSGKDELLGLILKSKTELLNAKFEQAVAGTVGPFASIKMRWGKRSNDDIQPRAAIQIIRGGHS
ncbi:TetR/AcrR family transcriptional regulator [Paenibacillus sp. SI8]|uniref:TetR/AcrR family transcriptional regulator n=1 Tax=unclassified Paenibacillus TaxID=185978 RepID=UPI0034650A78